MIKKCTLIHLHDLLSGELFRLNLDVYMYCYCADLNTFFSLDIDTGILYPVELNPIVEKII